MYIFLAQAPGTKSKAQEPADDAKVIHPPPKTIDEAAAPRFVRAC